ncbi:ATP-NAD kinase-like domain-containing protein [Talaromyces proteolyticus]|uniref:ATP-NAD kinase-like domain-containing protein n=1 Tax=Talaromyces proteolyticus TaxID=1131652 RepID=A0AAD4KKS6_9EURO|nr:ATP-NAD kinase-like domain-containing protein [Talaromyces proteolyticus]KAH8693912.1 ATP-NAD kinase-like domain-containing protein [Talaromyces proteolyticus]
MPEYYLQANPQQIDRYVDWVARRITRTIRYVFILWVQFNEGKLCIEYAKERRDRLHVKTLCFHTIETCTSQTIQGWADSLTSRAYRGSKIGKSIKVFLNPFSGKGFAVKGYYEYADPLFTAAHCRVEVQTTKYSGHAQELVREDPDINSWDVIACCSGDGLPHEVLNGLAQREDAGQILRNIPVIQLPGGSGNAMCVSLFETTSISHAALYTIKGVPHSIDLMSVTQGDKRRISFLSQNFGYLAECDLQTEHMRHLGGARFLVGFLQRIFNPPVYGCDIAIHKDSNGDRNYEMGNEPKDSMISNESTNQALPCLRFGTDSDEIPNGWTLERHANSAIIFAGQLPFVDATSKVFPSAKLDDGMVDMILVDAGIGSLKFLKILLEISKGTHVRMREVHYRKVAAYRVSPMRTDGSLSVDGEMFPFAPFQVEVHQQLGMTLLPPESIKYSS